jgi:hypothetical protein
MFPLFGLIIVLAASPAPRTVDSLGWLAGTWEGTDSGVASEETWTVPRGGTLLGVHRDVRDGRTVSFEFLRIETTPAGLVYLASPQGKPATPFTLKELGERKVVFENPNHDFPQRILYWIAEDGALHARIEGKMGEKAASQEWRWIRR